MKPDISRTRMADVFFRALCFIAFCSLLTLFSLNLSNFYTTQRCGIIYGGFYWTSGVYYMNLQPSLIRISGRARRVGFHCTKLSLTKWTRRGRTSSIIAGHDPRFDITIFMEILLKPGPMNFATNFQNGSSLTQGCNLHIPKPAITTHAFSRDQPLSSHPITSLVSMRRSTAVVSRTLIEFNLIT